jgi:hypothetical protein
VSYGLIVHLQLLSTPPRGDAVTFGFSMPEHTDKDFHLADSMQLRAHWHGHLARGFTGHGLESRATTAHRDRPSEPERRLLRVERSRAGVVDQEFEVASAHLGRGLDSVADAAGRLVGIARIVF